MYRQYTTTGTNKLKGIFLFFLIFGVVGSRVVYFFLNKEVLSDTYGYFEAAMVRLEAGEPTLNSGLAYAYTRNLSGILKFTGNRMEVVGGYQMFLQICGLLLLFSGLVLLTGWIPGGVSGCILLFSPQVMETMLVISPGNYFLLHTGVILVILGGIYRRMKKRGWTSGDGSRLCLIATGFYVGVVCTWNLSGLILVFVMGYVLVRGHQVILSWPEEAEKAPRIMKTGTQALALCEGFFFGIFVTLLKYTGVTGQALVEQLSWWFIQFQNPLRQLQDIQIPLLIWSLGAAGAGIICRFMYGLHQKKRKDASDGETTMEVREKVEEVQDNYVITEDGRKIKLLDNPLPGPKKHVKRAMEFDITDVTERENLEDDFDIQIEEDDDFDIKD